MQVIASLSLFAGVPAYSQVPAPEGWKYFDGDEFNDTAPKATHWGLYGASGIWNATYGRQQGMIQTYRPEQVTMHELPSGEKICRITSVKGSGAPDAHGLTGWWSGALSSRDAPDTPGKKYYPLYCRMEIKAKAPNVAGVWHAFWSRHYKGASTAELDLQEFFVRTNGPEVLSQATHLKNTATGATDLNYPRNQGRHTPVSNPSANFHVYGVQILPDPDHINEAIISYFLDGAETMKFSTHEYPGHNSFILDAIAEGRTQSTWDFAITGQIGGTTAGVLYPEDALETVVTEIDWVRVYVPDEALPVSLVTFTGTQTGDLLNFSWTTATEKGTARFEIERSTDGKAAFQKIGMVAASNNNEGQQYSFSTLAVKQSPCYYRLKIIDRDNSFSFSNLILICPVVSDREVIAFPNPVADKVLITFPVQRTESLLRLYSAEGVLLRSVSLREGSGSYEADLSGFQPGSYFLSIRSGGAMYNQKLLKE